MLHFIASVTISVVIILVAFYTADRIRRWKLRREMMSFVPTAPNLVSLENKVKKQSSN